MGLAGTLGARAARQGRSAPVVCGELGTLTVEALPVRELELLLRGADGNRAVFYAACRELQAAGEELRKAGKVFAPDGIMQFVSDSEAAAAARTVLELSGWTEKNSGQSQALNLESRGREFNLNENRLPIVQEKSDDENAKTQVQTGSNRLAPVQFDGVSDPGFGQVSRETGTKITGFDTVPESDKKAQVMGILPPKRTQNVVTEENPSLAGDGSGGASDDPLHETESEFSKSLHETESEFQNGLHETTSELAEAVARRLVEGLRRAKWVRGD